MRKQSDQNSVGCLKEINKSSGKNISHKKHCVVIQAFSTYSGNNVDGKLEKLDRETIPSRKSL